MGTFIIHGKKIFKAGTFKDSTGREHTWTTADLDKIVDHYHTLRRENALTSVPVRVDHSFTARDLVGWISDVYRLGEFLHADLHLTESEAFFKWARGTFEPVSAEIAAYETNNGDVFTPTLVGVAFVDVPAVEGLFRASGVEPGRVTAVPVDGAVLDSSTGSVYERAQEAQSMGTRASDDLAGLSTAELTERFGGKAQTMAAHSTATVVEHPGQVTPPAQKDPEEDEGGVSDATVGDAPGQGDTETPSVDGAGDGASAAVPVEAGDSSVPEATEPQVTEGKQPATQPATHAAAPGAVATFRVNGVPMTDPALVQAHIDALEKFRAEARDNERREFVTGLVRDNKILANQAEALTDLALSMDDAQFAKFRSSYESAGVNPLLDQHGMTREDAAHVQVPSGQSVDAVRAEIQTLEEIVARHRMAGKDEEWIKGTSSYRKLTELKNQLNG